MWQLISSCNGAVLDKATSIVARVGGLHSGLMINRLETALVSLTREEVDEEQTDFALSQLNMMSNVTFNTDALVRIINQVSLCLKHAPCRSTTIGRPKKSTWKPFAVCYLRFCGNGLKEILRNSLHFNIRPTVKCQVRARQIWTIYDAR